MTSIWPRVWELAGILRMDPMPWSMFELDAMATAARCDAWDRKAFELAQRFNANRGKGVTQKKPADFHPWPNDSDLFRVRGVSNPKMWEHVKDKWTGNNDS